MKTLLHEDQPMLEKLMKVCRATQVSADGRQAMSASRVEQVLAQMRDQITASEMPGASSSDSQPPASISPTAFT